jgi:hypothetical protein
LPRLSGVATFGINPDRRSHYAYVNNDPIALVDPTRLAAAPEEAAASVDGEED